MVAPVRDKSQVTYFGVQPATVVRNAQRVQRSDEVVMTHPDIIIHGGKQSVGIGVWR